MHQLFSFNGLTWIILVFLLGWKSNHPLLPFTTVNFEPFPSPMLVNNEDIEIVLVHCTLYLTIDKK